ncbi:peptidoglycan-binding protein [Streptacidiphilus pinicola]|uniref:Peptidoglycan-binding protein n=1 Tax=Streptacidiphilus pinicola TaxID=2219663 RepID=A0A2X0K4Q5_9ACTN|nr:peptidoglycan-binding protein [Streptacidiphilus pinicola]RAG82529.1 peptidoglycan-binding protein [Streptacidiphilus pinicola]
MSISHKRRQRRSILIASVAAVVAGAGIYAAAGAGASVTGPVAAARAGTNWISYTGGKLVYGHDAQGNRVPDYSAAGYEGGGVALPVAAVRQQVGSPSGKDDTARIQAAINAVAKLPVGADGLRGAVLLAPGQYRIDGTLTIDASGVVLRGSGSGTGGTGLVAHGATARTLITVGGSSRYTAVGTPTDVTDSYVPVGATSLDVASTAGLKVGSEVVVQRPTTQAWLDAIGMQSLWKPNWSLYSERKVTAISGHRLTLDVPLTTALEHRYTQATVYRYTFPRIDHVGLESLSADGRAMAADPNYAKDFYGSSLSSFGAVQDSWVRDVTGYHFGQNGVTGLGSQSRRISVLHTATLDMLVNNATSARSDGYTLEGQQNLVQDCLVTASKIHAFTTEARQSGPNVYSRCTAKLTQTAYDSGGHQRWGSGTLYDQVTVAGTLLLVNNGTRGTGHGWSDANSTAWNCVTTGGYEVQQPATAHNWAFGCTGPLLSGSNGEVVSNGSPVPPASLYDEQLRERGLRPVG